MNSSKNSRKQIRKLDKVAENTVKMPFTTRLLLFFLLLFVVIILVIQLERALDTAIKTEPARFYSTTETLDFKGVYARDEKLIPYNGGGIITYTHPDGSKIARNSAVAKSYYSSSDIELQRRISRLEEKLKIYNDAEKLENTSNTQKDSFSAQISNKHTELLYSVNFENYSDIPNLKNEYLNLLCKKQIVVGAVQNFTNEKTALQNEIDNLEARISRPPNDVIVDEAGYFVSETDGYENLITIENAETITEDEINSVENKPVLQKQTGVAGKVIDSYNWKLIALIETEKMRRLNTDTVTLRTDTGKYLTMKISSSRHLPDGKSIVIFQCDTLAPEYAGRRVSLFKLMLSDYKGIRIPAEAIRFNEQGEKGVFVKTGIAVAFKKFNQILMEADFVLAEDTTDKDGYISLYDDVITEGKDLYEGKIVL